MAEQEIYNQMEIVRQSGAINMVDKNGVKRVAREMGFHELVAHLDETGAADYMELLETFPEEAEV